MNEKKTLPRSPELMSADDSAMVVVDVQEKLVKLISGHERLVWNIRRLIDGAKVLGVPVVATEQYPEKLGPTTPELADRLDAVSSKMRFSCGECASVFEDLAARGIHKLLVVGIEAHVCIQQTVFDLMSNGFEVHVAVDATGARFAVDCETALRRMESSGAVLSTTETALFEWCEVSGTPEFKQISAIVREPPPGE